jgi:hypothetical protein
MVRYVNMQPFLRRAATLAVCGRLIKVGFKPGFDGSVECFQFFS